MFDYDESGIHEAFHSLYIEKLLVENGKPPSGLIFCWDNSYELFMHALENCAESAEYSCAEDDYYSDIAKWTYTDSAMTNYLRLANLYGRLAKVRFRNNPFIKPLMSKINSFMEIQSYCYDWDFVFKPQNGFIPRLEVFIAPEFDCYSWLIGSILEVMQYFKNGVKEIEKEIRKMKKYQVEIVETLSRIVEIKAESEENAEDIVLEKYRDEEIVLTADDFAGVEILAA